MSCSSIDLKAYFLGELAAAEKTAAESHIQACAGCRDELDRLRLTQTALQSLEEEEIPQRIAFVSDKVFEPRWWQTMWRSAPAMGFASAAMLAAAILAHGFARPAPIYTPAPIDTAQIDQRVEREVSARLDDAVRKAVGEMQTRQAQQFAKVLDAAEKRYEFQRQADVAATQQSVRYLEKQMARFLVASNEVPGQ